MVIGKLILLQVDVSPVPLPFVEDTVLLPLNGTFRTFVEVQLILYVKVNFWALYSIDLHMYPYASTTMFYYSFAESFEVMKWEDFNFVLSFQDCFHYSGSHDFLYEF